MLPLCLHTHSMLWRVRSISKTFEINLSQMKTVTMSTPLVDTYTVAIHVHWKVSFGINQTKSFIHHRACVTFVSDLEPHLLLNWRSGSPNYIATNNSYHRFSSLTVHLHIHTGERWVRDDISGCDYPRKRGRTTNCDTPQKRGRSYKPEEEYSEWHRRRLKRQRTESCSQSLSWIEDQGFIPVSVMVRSAYTGKEETIHLCESRTVWTLWTGVKKYPNNIGLESE